MSVYRPVGDFGRVFWGVAGGIVGYFLTLIVGVKVFELEKPEIDWIAASGAVAFGVGSLILASRLMRRLTAAGQRVVRLVGLVFFALAFALYFRVVLV